MRLPLGCWDQGEAKPVFLRRLHVKSHHHTPPTSPTSPHPAPTHRERGSKGLHRPTRGAKFFSGDSSDAWDSGCCLIWVRKFKKKKKEGLKVDGCGRAGLGASIFQQIAFPREGKRPGQCPAWELLGMFPFLGDLRAGAGRLFLPVFPGDRSWRPRVPSPAGTPRLPGRC